VLATINFPHLPFHELPVHSLSYLSLQAPHFSSPLSVDGNGHLASKLFDCRSSVSTVSPSFTRLIDFWWGLAGTPIAVSAANNGYVFLLFLIINLSSPFTWGKLVYVIAAQPLFLMPIYFFRMICWIWLMFSSSHHTSSCHYNPYNIISYYFNWLLLSFVDWKIWRCLTFPIHRLNATSQAPFKLCGKSRLSHRNILRALLVTWYPLYCLMLDGESRFPGGVKLKSD